MTSAATATPTNEQIAELLGIEHKSDPGFGSYWEWTEHPDRWCHKELPDFDDSHYLKWAEVYCRERGWDWKAQQFASGVKVEIPYDRHWHTVSALADTLPEAFWTAIYRAAEAVKDA